MGPILRSYHRCHPVCSELRPCAGVGSDANRLRLSLVLQAFSRAGATGNKINTLGHSVWDAMSEVCTKDWGVPKKTPGSRGDSNSR